MASATDADSIGFIGGIGERAAIPAEGASDCGTPKRRPNGVLANPMTPMRFRFACFVQDMIDLKAEGPQDEEIAARLASSAEPVFSEC